ncbi:uncharacterized protein LOC111369890 [Olea europaea var. sylvestris]|uniref:Uncharacterized protein n=1 Tax=Olea europaea subsp. europaea TaxID=158383 RepID=A0A8S0V6E1_OLEEU|nr:uncharacterized protein LOC111369890 [Olea europaea var. sylvestris]CAA3025686.1 Hypothetical predicted protein [Olea europaea subsp. europaea]
MNQDDPGSAEEEITRAQKRRGRPQKSLNDDIDEEEAEKIQNGESEDTTDGVLGNETKCSTASQNGKKRKRNSQVKEKIDSVKEKNGNGTTSSTEESNKLNGFRREGNRRKNKPCRAPEAGVDCN